MTNEMREAYEIAKRLKGQKKFQEALDFLEENLLETEHNSSSIHYLEGECYEGIGDLQIACLSYKNAYLSTLIQGY